VKHWLEWGGKKARAGRPPTGGYNCRCGNPKKGFDEIEVFDEGDARKKLLGLKEGKGSVGPLFWP